MRTLCRALLVANVAYCILALTVPGLPGWRMFEAVEDTRYELSDRDGRPVDLAAWLPRGAKVVDRSELRAIVAFVCQKAPERAPLSFVEHATGARYVVLAPGCSVDARR